MADEPQKNPGNPIPTEGFPVVYSNIASLAANFNDLRIYFAEIQPKSVVTVAAPVPAPEPAGAAMAIVPAEANISPRICMVMTPEFAKSLNDALSSTLSLYEKQFGQLRPAPQIPTQRLASR
jgi:Protein of unknown function (DUF3467)